MSELQNICLVQYIGKYGMDDYENIAAALKCHPLLGLDVASTMSAAECKAAFVALLTKENINFPSSGLWTSNDRLSDLTTLLRTLCARRVAILKEELRSGEREYLSLKTMQEVQTELPAEIANSAQDTVNQMLPKTTATESATLPITGQHKMIEDPGENGSGLFNANVEGTITDGVNSGTPVPPKSRRTRTRSNTLNTVMSTDSTLHDEVAVDQLLKKKAPRPSRRNTVRESDRSPAPSSTGDENDAAITLKRFQSAVTPLVSNITSHRFASVFMHPVSDKDAPNYSDVIKTPIDLKCIKAQIKSGDICSVNLFHRSILLMLSNAVMYNAEDSEIAKMAREVFDHSGVKCLNVLRWSQADHE